MENEDYDCIDGGKVGEGVKTVYSELISLVYTFLSLLKIAKAMSTHYSINYVIQLATKNRLNKYG